MLGYRRARRCDESVRSFVLGGIEPHRGADYLHPIRAQVRDPYLTNPGRFARRKWKPVRIYLAFCFCGTCVGDGCQGFVLETLWKQRDGALGKKSRLEIDRCV